MTIRILKLLLLISFCTSAQTSSKEAYKKSIPFEKIEVAPLAPNYKEKWSLKKKKKYTKTYILKYFQNNIIKDSGLKMNGVIRVGIGFLIDDKGSVKFPIVKTNFPDLRDVIIEAIDRLPKFKPGEKNGKPVNVSFVIPIVIKLS